MTIYQNLGLSISDTIRLFSFINKVSLTLTTTKKREIEPNLLRDALYQKLREGWNPQILDPNHQQSSLTFIEALDFALEKKTPNIGKKTLSGYKGTVNFIKVSDCTRYLKQTTYCKNQTNSYQTNNGKSKRGAQLEL